MEKIRLQKYMADAGIMSRRAAEEEIKRGNVSVNGHVANLGMKIDPKNDHIAYRGQKIKYQKDISAPPMTIAAESVSPIFSTVSAQECIL